MNFKLKRVHKIENFDVIKSLLLHTNIINSKVTLSGYLIFTLLFKTLALILIVSGMEIH